MYVCIYILYIYIYLKMYIICLLLNKPIKGLIFVIESFRQSCKLSYLPIIEPAVMFTLSKLLWLPMICPAVLHVYL